MTDLFRKLYTRKEQEEMAEDARKLYRAGLCPCCGSELGEWTDNDYEVIEPQAIGEGVMLCGRCIGNKHHEGETSVTEFMLRALMNVRSRAT